MQGIQVCTSAYWCTGGRPYDSLDDFVWSLVTKFSLLIIGLLAVTFSRIEADGKLVMGYRKAPTSLSSQVRAHLHHLMLEMF